MYIKLPNDDFFDEIDPILKLFMLHSWQRDQDRDLELRKNIAVLSGYFSNPELAQKYIKDMNPTVASTEEEFEQSTQMMLEDRAKWMKEQKNKHRRRRIKPN